MNKCLTHLEIDSSGLGGRATVVLGVPQPEHQQRGTLSSVGLSVLSDSPLLSISKDV